MSYYLFEDIANNIVDRVDPQKGDEKTYIGLEHISDDSLFVTSFGSKTELIGQKIKMKRGDILFARRNAYLRRVGIAPFDGIFSAHGLILRPKTEIISEELFPFLIKSDNFMNCAVKISVGSLSPTVNWKDLKKEEFFIPSKNSQSQYAKLLWSLEDLIEQYKRQESYFDKLIKSRFIEMFNEYFDDKKCQSLGSLCNLFVDGDWIESKDQDESGIRLIQTGNVGEGQYLDKIDKARYINEDTFNRLKCTEVLPGDILVSRLPDPIARSCIVPDGLGKSITGVDCTIIRFKKEINPVFFNQFTSIDMYLSQVNSFEAGSTRKRISRKNLGKIKVPVPPIELQNDFESFVKQIDKSKFELMQHIENTKKLQKSIINDVFSPKDI